MFGGREEHQGFVLGLLRGEPHVLFISKEIWTQRKGCPFFFLSIIVTMSFG